MSSDLRINPQTDALRGIEVRPGDCERARRAMEAAGVRFVRSRDVAKKVSEALLQPA